MTSNPPSSDITTETVHGATVVDAYRWLEDRHSVRTQTWLVGQQERRERYFGESHGLDQLRSYIGRRLNVTVLDQPIRVGDYVFFRRRSSDQEQASLYIRDVKSESETILVDPSALGPFTSVAIHFISDDGSFLAYELKVGGTDTTEIHLVDVATGETLPDFLPQGYARGFAFGEDRPGFYYCHELISNYPWHTVRFHRLGEAGEDVVLFRRKCSPDSRLILISDEVHLGAVLCRQDSTGTYIDFWLAQRHSPATWTMVFSNRPAPCSPMLHRGRIFVRWEEDGKTTVAEIDDQGIEIRIIVPEFSVAIEGIAIVDEHLYISGTEGVDAFLRVWTLKGGAAASIAIPEGHSIQLVTNRCNNATALFYTCQSFVSPVSLWMHIPETEASSLWFEMEACMRSLPCRVDSVQYRSPDGVEIPMLLVMRRDLDRSVARPVILTSYGGFGVSMTPRFSILVTAMLERGAIFAVPNIRGGREFGRSWYEAAQGKKRQTAFNDFIRAAEWLIDHGMTTPSQLAIFGGSNSGLLVAVAMTQRPDLFRAVLCIAPLLDMLRYERFDNAKRWRSEYGTVDNPEDFAVLRAYSPYHNVKQDIDYPSILFISGDQDERCNPAHARKMAAHLQNRDAQRNPVLLDYSLERGHSPTLPLTVRVEALSRRVAFLCKELGMDLHPGGNA